MSKKASSSLSESKKEERNQRALILQGGGALGAYEAGAVSKLVELLNVDDKNEHMPSFDVVAGSSIGSVNAALLVGKIIELTRNGESDNSYQAWKEASDTLLKFWKDIAASNHVFHPTFYADLLTNDPFFWGWWKYRRWLRTILDPLYNMLESSEATTSDENATPNPVKAVGNYMRRNYKFGKDMLANSWFSYLYFYMFPDTYEEPANWENARRYVWSKTAFVAGAPNVLGYFMPQPNMKYEGPNLLLAKPEFVRYNNAPLSDFMRHYWDYENYKIRTTEGEPRLLVVTVDAQDSTNAVAFDSYEKDVKGSRYTEYGAQGSKTRVENPDGVEIKHVIASMSTHQRYEFPKFRVSLENGQEEYRPFWDGAYLSNTPLRQVIHHHRHYYHKIKQKAVPNLQPFIINLYPTVDKTPLDDSDTIQDREIDIKFHDRSTYDIKIAQIFSDHYEMIEELKEFAEEQLQHIQDQKKRQDLQSRLDNLLKGSIKTRSKDKGGNTRKRSSLLEGRFKLERPVHIRRRDDENAIFGKAFDFSSSTIAQLIEQGKEDAKNAYEEMKRDQVAETM